MKKIVGTVLLGAVAVVGTGCATIFDGANQNVRIDSKPQGAQVYVGKIKDGAIVDKASVGVTPATINIARKKVGVIVEMDGYQPREVTMTKKMNPWVWGDILATSLLSTSIDTSTGASSEYDPDNYFVELTPSDADVMPTEAEPTPAE